MKMSGVLAAVVALLAVAAVTPSASAQEITDVDVLNFALNLEYLEAEFYSYATTGEGLSEEDIGEDAGETIGGEQVANLTGPTAAFAAEIARHELEHVRFLRAALGDAAVSKPVIDIGPAFEAAANAALNMTLDPPFSPYGNSLFFLHGAFIFEDVGVSAYQGAAALIQNKTYLTPAAGILAVEAYHAGNVRRQLYLEAETVVQPYGVNVSTIVQAIANARAALSMTMDQGILLNNTANLVPTDENSITYDKMATEILSIVTLGATNGRGGFFPEGLNGVIGAAAPAAAPSDDDAETPSEEPAETPASDDEVAPMSG